MDNILNLNNDGWITGKYPLFLGQKLGLHDTMNRPYPELFDLFKQLKAVDWSENEFDLEQARMDFLTCDKNTYDIMIKTLAWQYEADSVASRSIVALLAPFVSNSDLNQMLLRWSDNEALHATTYSEIVRQCIAEPTEVFNEVVNNDSITARSTAIVATLEELRILGAKYILDKDSLDMEYVRAVLLKSVVALYCLEGMEFLASFACTFALAERDLFLPIASYVQKIMIDETIHTRMDEALIDILVADPVWLKTFQNIAPDIKVFVDEVYQQELAWSKYIFSEGRSVVGLTEELLVEWVQWKAQVIYDKLGLELPFERVKTNPLTWMDTWLDIDSQQIAAQEKDLGNYRLNSVYNDEKENEVFDFNTKR
jgi:ribonucleoside-diphosphate reductase beta chain